MGHPHKFSEMTQLFLRICKQFMKRDELLLEIDKTMLLIFKRLSSVVCQGEEMLKPLKRKDELKAKLIQETLTETLSRTA